MESSLTRFSDGNPASYSPPHISEISALDDWTSVKDRTLKKRIQNRVAQRTYRQRMKSRVADLQAKLDICERKLRSGDNDQGDDGASEGSLGPLIQARGSLRRFSPVDSLAKAGSTTLDGTLSRRRGTTTTNCAGPGVLAMSNSQISENCDGNRDIDVADEGNRSPQVLSRAQDEEPQQMAICGTDPQHTLSNLMSIQADTFEDNSSCASYLDTAFSSWDTGTLKSPIIGQVPWTDDVRPARQRNNQLGILIPHDDGNPRPISRDGPRCLISNPADMDMVERVACILTYLGAMGFDNFDELVCTYYAQNFEETSFLYNEQRLSRNRRLPGVISSVFCAARKWSTWERRGFQEEISKATEAMLISESSGAQSDIQPAVEHVLEAVNSNLPCVASSVSPLKACIINKMPCLWTLMMALATSIKPVWNKEASDAVFAAILLLQYGGRMEKKMLLELVRLCL